MHRSRRILAALAALAALTTLAACGDDDEDTASPSASASEAEAASEADTETCEPDDSGFPLSIDNADDEVSLDAPPVRIVSLSPSATESLFAIGAGCQVHKVDDNSNYPEEAPTSDLSGYEPNVEAIAAENPDLVVMAGTTPDAVVALRDLGVQVLVHPAAVDVQDVYDQLEELGEVTGRAEEAAATVEEMSEEIAGIAEAAEGEEELTYYWELDPTYYSATGDTFIGKLLALIGLESVADGAEGAGDYPQLSAEAIIQADPDLVILADTKCCQQDAEAVATRPGWSNLAAVRDGAVVELDDDVASRWGPRIVDLLAQVAEVAEKVRAAA